MDFTFSEDQLLLQTTVRDFLAAECTPERIRERWDSEGGAGAELWGQLAEIGVPGLLVPEAHEGMGMNEVDFVLVLEETGRAGLSEPIVGTAAVAVPLLAELGDDALAGRWLKAIATGEAKVAVAHPDSAFVADADTADLLLLGTQDGALHAIERGQFTCTRETATDPGRRVFSVEAQTSDATQVAKGDAAGALLAAAFDRGALGSAAQQLGACDRMIELAVDYAKQRTQFGVPIGSFQAVKHMLADLKVKVEYARPLVYRAAHSVARRHRLRAQHVSMAKQATTRAGLACARTTLQAHGAIGYTWEQDLHIFMRRAWSLSQDWGDERFHRERVGEGILAPNAELGPDRTFAA